MNSVLKAAQTTYLYGPIAAGALLVLIIFLMIEDMIRVWQQQQQQKVFSENNRNNCSVAGWNCEMTDQLVERLYYRKLSTRRAYSFTDPQFILL